MMQPEHSNDVSAPRLVAVRSSYGSYRWFAVREGDLAHSAQAVAFPEVFVRTVVDLRGEHEERIETGVVGFARRRDLAEAARRCGAELLPGTMAEMSTRAFLHARALAGGGGCFCAECRSTRG